jgi:hypothetical protein
MVGIQRNRKLEVATEDINLYGENPKSKVLSVDSRKMYVHDTL